MAQISGVTRSERIPVLRPSVGTMKRREDGTSNSKLEEIHARFEKAIEESVEHERSGGWLHHAILERFIDARKAETRSLMVSLLFAGVFTAVATEEAPPMWVFGWAIGHKSVIVLLLPPMAAFCFYQATVWHGVTHLLRSFLAKHYLKSSPELVFSGLTSVLGLVTWFGVLQELPEIRARGDGCSLFKLGLVLLLLVVGPLLWCGWATMWLWDCFSDEPLRRLAAATAVGLFCIKAIGASFRGLWED